MKYFKHMCHSHQDEKLQELIDKFGPEGYGVYWLLCERIGLNLQDFNDFRKHSVKNWAHFCKIRPTKLTKMVEFMSNLENFSQKKSLIISKFDQNQLLIKIPNLIKYRDEYSIKKTRISGQTPDKLRTNSGQTPDIVRRKQKQKQKQKQNNIYKKQIQVNTTDLGNTTEGDKTVLPDAAVTVKDFESFIKNIHKFITGKTLNLNNQNNIEAIKELKNYPVKIINIAAKISRSQGGKGLKYLLTVVKGEYRNYKNFNKSSEKIIHKCIPNGAAIHKFSLNETKDQFQDPPRYGFYMCMHCKEIWLTFEDIP